MYESIILHTDCLEQVNMLDMEQRGELLTAILLYASGEDLPQLDPVVAMAFSFIRAKIDREKKKYSETIEKRKAGGSRGGRPKNEHGKEDTPAEEETEADCQGEGDKPHPDGAIEVQCSTSKDEPQTEKPQGFLEQDKNLKVFKKPQGFFEAEKNPVPVPVPVPVPDPVPVPVPVPDIEKEKGSPTGSPKRKPTAFHPPPVEEVKAYCEERKNNVDPERFVDFYASKGWKVGNQSMKDWRAAVRTWERSENARSGTPPARSAPIRRNGFVNFDQRPLDFDALAKKKQDALQKMREDRA